MKRRVQQGVRWLHVKLARKALPRKLAIYFHELEPHQLPAFRAALTHLLDGGYRPVTASEFVLPPSDDKQLFVSFDDNYKSWLAGLPLLDQLGVRAMFYTNTLPLRDSASAAQRDAYFERIAFQGERVALLATELRQISDAGHEIGCHTHSHFALTELPRARWDAEIKDSKRRLEDITGRAVRHFSYPYGMRRFMPPDLPAYCRGIGFETIARGIPGLQHSRRHCPPMIERTNWRLQRPVAENIENLQIDGRAFERLTGRSAIG